MKKSKFLFLLACVFAVFSLTACEFDLPDVPGLPDKIEIPEIEMPGFIKDIIGDDSADDNNDDGNEDVPHTHEYTWTIKQHVKCNVDGIEVGICECGETTTREIKAEGHKFVVDAAVEPSHTATGLTEGKHCEVCGFVEVMQEVIPESHEEVVDAAVAATCTTAGLTEGKHCSVCEKVLVAQKEVAAFGHKREVLPAVETTCKAPGKTEGEKCSVCDVILVAQEEVAQLEHTPGAAASFTSAQTCTVCGEELVGKIRDITIYYYNSKKWSKVNIWAWNAAGTNYSGGTWPGKQISSAPEIGQNWYSFTITNKDLAGLKIIFNNGSTQTPDITVYEGKTYFYGENLTGYASKAEVEDAIANSQPEVMYDWYIRGSINGWTGSEQFGLKKEGSVYTITIKLAAGDQLKIVDDKTSWNGKNLGYNDVVDKSRINGSSDGNIVIKTAGTYTFTVQSNKITISIA